MEENNAPHKSTAKEEGGSTRTTIPKDLKEFLGGIPHEQPLAWAGKERPDGKRYLVLWKQGE